MVAIPRMRSAMLGLLLVAIAVSAWEDEDQLLPSSPQPGPVVSFVEHSANKRSFFNSCSSFDRSVIDRLDNVCDDCYNYFRRSDVAITCRSNCYRNQVFYQCLDELYPNRIRNQYRVALQRVGK